MSRRPYRPVKFRPRFEVLEAREVPSAVTVQADQTVRVLNNNIFGLNLNNYDGVLSAQAYSTTDTTPDPVSVQLLQSAGVRMTRLSHGSGTDSWHFDVENSLGSTAGAGVLANVTAAVAAESMVAVNYGTGTSQEAAAYLAYLNGSAANNTNLGVAGGKNWQTAGFWASLRGQNKLAVNDGYNHLRLGRAAPFGFKYFEVGNEAYFGLWNGGNPKTPAAYAAFTEQFADLAAQIDPNAKIGVGVGNPIEYDNLWNKPVLDALNAVGYAPGFLSDHFYIYDGKNETPLTDVQLLTQSVSDPTSKMPIHANSPRNWAGRSAAYRTLLNTVYGGGAAGVELLVGEFNIDADGSTKQTVALTNGLFMADALGSLLQTEYNGAMIWNFRNAYLPAFHANPAGISGWRAGTDNGIVGTTDKNNPPEAGLNIKYPAYFGLQLASMLGTTGDKVVPVATDTVNVSAYAVRQADGSLSLLLINKSPTAADTATVSIAGFLPAAGANQWRYGVAEDNAQRDSADGAASLSFTNPNLNVVQLANGGQFAVNLPAFSMTLLDLAPMQGGNVYDIALTGNTVAEFRPGGTGIGTLSATPAGGYTFTLVPGAGADDNGAFVLSGNQLLAARPFDFAVKTAYAIRVRATDGTGAFAEKAFTVTVTDDASAARDGRALHVAGTAGDDSFSFAAGETEHLYALNGVLMAVPVADVDAVVFHGTGGSDAAVLYGRGTGNVAGLSPTYGVLKGTGFEVWANGTSQLGAVAGGSGGVAYLTGTAGDDKFAGTPTYATLANAGFSNTAGGFGSVVAYANSGQDVAYLAGSAGDDTYVGTPTYAILTGAGFYNQAEGFRFAVGYSNGGNDVAYLGDSAGDDTFVATVADAIMTGATYFNGVVGFRNVAAYATDGNDAAFLADSPGDDNLTANGSAAELTSAVHFVHAEGFDGVRVFGFNGGTNKKQVGILNFFLDTPGVWI